jgi:hypothetical protein
MEPEDSLPYSQELVTGPYPEPDQFSPHHSILVLYTFYEGYSESNFLRAVNKTRNEEKF